MGEVEQLIEEIEQIQVQYKREVGGRRKQWPRSIKERVLRLSSAGLKFREIEDRTGISYHTVASWSAPKQKPKFHQLPVVSKLPRELATKEIATVTVAKDPKSAALKKHATVTVTTPEGFVLGLFTILDAVMVLKLLRGGR